MTTDYLDSLGNQPTAEVMSKLPFRDFIRLVSESTTDASKRLLTIEEVKKVTGLGRTAIYDLMARGEFPRCQRNTGGQGRTARWQAQKIYDWCSR